MRFNFSKYFLALMTNYCRMCYSRSLVNTVEHMYSRSASTQELRQSDIVVLPHKLDHLGHLGHFDHPINISGP